MFRFPHFLLAGALFVSTPLLSSPLYAQTSLSPNISTPRVLGASGVRREAGAWIFNDSIFVAPRENIGISNNAVFIANLRRDKKNKLPFFRAATTRAPLGWATMPLPDLRAIGAPNFNFAALQAQLLPQVNAARLAGRSYVGWSLPSGIENGQSAPLNKENVTAVVKQLRAVLDAVAPESALILQVDASANPSLAADDIDAAASFCDAVLLNAQTLDRSALWPLKMARRVAEEQPDFDLPIFVAPISNSEVTDKVGFEARLMEFWMGGATGFIVPDAQIPLWANVISRNAGLFAGAVTLEDAAVLPSPNPQTARIVEQLRAAGRVPLIGRLPAESARNGESLFAVLDEQTSLETLNRLDKTARNGATIYLEGAPDLKNKTLVAKLGDMTNSTLEILPAPKTEVLALSDPWVFGTARGREFGVTQRLKWTLKTSLAAQTRKKKGEVLLDPFSAAKLSSDENGLLIAPLGKGRIVWLAHAPRNNPADEAARRPYYAAIAGNLQGALAGFEFASVEESVRSGSAVHVALRASKTGTPIIVLFNDGANSANVLLSARSDAPIALDLNTEREIAATVSAYSSNVKVTVPARGFAWLTFGAKRATLDKERLAPRPKARTIK